MSGQLPQRPTDTAEMERWLAAIDGEIAGLEAERRVVARALSEANERRYQREYKQARPQLRRREKRKRMVAAAATPAPVPPPTLPGTWLPGPPRRTSIRDRLVRRAARVGGGGD